MFSPSHQEACTMLRSPSWPLIGASQHHLWPRNGPSPWHACRISSLILAVCAGLGQRTTGWNRSLAWINRKLRSASACGSLASCKPSAWWTSPEWIDSENPPPVALWGSPRRNTFRWLIWQRLTSASWLSPSYSLVLQLKAQRCPRWYQQLSSHWLYQP